VVGDIDETRTRIQAAAQPDCEAAEVLFIPAVRLGALDGMRTTVVAFTTDIPAFGDTWGKPFLIGPGSIHVAHTSGEFVPKDQLLEAVSLYEQMVQRLLQGQQ
jgi:acetylornithine deacetylase